MASQGKGAVATAADTRRSKTGHDTLPLQKFFLNALKDILWAEHAIISGLQKMQEAATNQELIHAFQDHELQTQEHINRLEKIFDIIGERIASKKCKAIEGILKEVEEIIEDTPEGSATRDATLIIAAQKVEHYEIASYGGLAAIAHTLQLTKAARLLQQTLDEEEETDCHLTYIAESHINFDAAQEDEAKHI